VGNTQLTLTADADESLRVRDIHVYSPASQYISIEVNRQTVGYFRVGGGVLGNHLHYPLTDEENLTIFGLLQKKGIFRPIPIPTGATLQITGAHDANSRVTVVYDQYDAGDVQSSEPNGRDSNSYDFMNYGRYSGTLADGENLYTVQQTTTNYPAFPFGSVVPAKHNITVHGVCFSDVAKSTGTYTNAQETEYLKFVRNRTVMFDNDFNGLPALAIALTADATNIGIGHSVAGNYDDVDQRLPLFFDPPLKFTEGEDVDVYVTTNVSKGAANIAAAEAEVGLICTAEVL